MKHIFLAMAAVTLPLACAKVSSSYKGEPQEILFQTATAPSTKANVILDASAKFKSYAYYLQDGYSWDSDLDKAQIYIDGATISHNSGRWHDLSAVHYWPLTGSLTFFAWTDNSSDPVITPAADGSDIVVTPQGYSLTNFSTTLNPNKDLMFADIARAKTGNETTYFQNGVPTLFKHILSKYEFKAKLGEVDEGVSFKIKSITFNGIDRKGSYDKTKAILWDYRSDKGEVVMVNKPEGTTLEPAVKTLDAINSILIPQSVGSDASITITYAEYRDNIQQGADKSSTAKISDIYARSLFQPGMKYTLTITIGQQEVFWAPGIREWETSVHQWYQ